MNNLMQWVGQMIQANPIMNPTQEQQEMLNALRNNDEKAGVALANKILLQNGISRERAMQIAQQRFHLPK